ncbi:MAG: helix-turn-helix transcriptional regulator [bacterium]|nr:helix-turn-helix transcriptional regulator [bacterium]
MRISYRPLWVILAQRSMTKKDLRTVSGISTASLAKLGKGENMTTDVLLKICEALNCNINEIMETVADDEVAPENHSPEAVGANE